jgi:hypothetical protein
MKFVTLFMTLLFLQITNVFAQDCRQSVFDILPNIEMLSGISDLGACQSTAESYQCDKVRDELAENEKDRVIKCDRESLKKNSLVNVSLGSCVWNGVKMSYEQLLDIKNLGASIAKEIATSFDCSQSVEKKRELLNAYNTTVQEKRFQLTEQFTGEWLNNASCGEIRQRIFDRYNSMSQVLDRERRAAQITSKKVKTIEGDNKSGIVDFSKTVKSILSSALNEAGTKYQCYTPKFKGEMLCTVVTSLLTDTLASGGVLVAVKRVVSLVKSTKALTTIERAVVSGKKINLEDSSKLLPHDRKKAASSILGRELTEAQEKAIMEAHEIGAKEKRGYFSYTSDDLRKKNKILKEAGITDQAEREALMRSGITGNFTSAEAKTSLMATMKKSLKDQRYSDEAAQKIIDTQMAKINELLDKYSQATAPELKATYARMLGEASSQFENTKAVRAFNQMGYEKIKDLPAKDAAFFKKQKNLDMYLEMAARSGDSEGIKKGMNEYVKQKIEVDAKRGVTWKNYSDLANNLLQNLDNEIKSHMAKGKKTEVYLEAALRKQKALLEEFPILPKSSDKLKDIEVALKKIATSE